MRTHSRDRRYRRSPSLTLSWAEDGIVCLDCRSGRRFLVPQEGVGFLSILSDWSTVAELRQRYPDLGKPDDIQRVVEWLQSRGLVERDDTSVDWPWSQWTPEAAGFHFGTRGGTYPQDPLAHDVTLVAKAKHDPPPATTKTLRGRRLQLAPPSQVAGRTLSDHGSVVETTLFNECPFLRELDVSPAEVRATSPLSLISGVEGVDAAPVCRNAPGFPVSRAAWDHPVNNCYSYANNERNVSSQFDGAQPGGTLTLTAAGIIAGATADGLIHLGDRIPTACPDEQAAHYVAICLLHDSTGKLKDYHCLRLDEDGTWSHKLGPHQQVTNQDQGSNAMNDLRTLKLRWSPTLVGIFRSVKGVRHLTFSAAS